MFCQIRSCKELLPLVAFQSDCTWDRCPWRNPERPWNWETGGLSEMFRRRSKMLTDSFLLTPCQPFLKHRGTIWALKHPQASIASITSSHFVQGNDFILAWDGHFKRRISTLKSSSQQKNFPLKECISEDQQTKLIIQVILRIYDENEPISTILWNLR